MIERELLSRRGSAYAIMGTDVLAPGETRVWLLCRSCGFCFPASRLAIDTWDGDDCPECAGGQTTAGTRIRMGDLIQP
ncbi:hypothetical protein [Pararhizobium sp.]|uniref:hypothetical protein n=1 Tax=Pararhizobium sp. TaxID=1977563 RepID=UPI00271C0991|nr:hypothetical protein [Pararhizobium sp.]MDO9416944.1 hypothetical protein [Pararhizobium sp.]